jgi:hypothetical protein
MGRGTVCLEDAQGKSKNAEWEIMPKKQRQKRKEEACEWRNRRKKGSASEKEELKRLRNEEVQRAKRGRVSEEEAYELRKN